MSTGTERSAVDRGTSPAGWVGLMVVAVVLQGAFVPFGLLIAAGVLFGVLRSERRPWWLVAAAAVLVISMSLTTAGYLLVNGSSSMTTHQAPIPRAPKG